MSDATTIRATIDRYLSSHSAGDIDGVVACFAPDAVVEDPIGTQRHHGSDELRAFFSGTHELCDSMRLDLTGPVRVVGRNVAFPMMAVSKIGEMTMEIDIIDVMVFDDEGRIAEMYAYWDVNEARTV